MLLEVGRANVKKVNNRGKNPLESRHCTEGGSQESCERTEGSYAHAYALIFYFFHTSCLVKFNMISKHSHNFTFIIIQSNVKSSLLPHSTPVNEKDKTRTTLSCP